MDAAEYETVGGLIVIGTDIEGRLAETFGEVGVEGALHARELDGAGEVRYRSEQVDHLASMGKVPILVALMRSIAAGEHSLEERVRIPAATAEGDVEAGTANTAARTLGPTGLSVMR